MRVQSFRDLLVWQKAIDLAEEIYALSAMFPAAERYGLTSQIRRAAVSVSNNIAEGSGRGTTPDLMNFLSYSRGSVKETESMILFSRQMRMFCADQAEKALTLTDEVSRMLWSLRGSLRSKSDHR